MEKHLYQKLAPYGISRRDFLKYCGSLAAMLGLSELYIPQIAAALEEAAQRPPVVYLSMSLCTGCTSQMANSFNPSVPELVLDILSFDYWDTVMAPAGKEAEKSLRDSITQNKGKYIACVEGSIPTGEDGNYLTIGGRTGAEIVKEVCTDAAAIIAIGSCGSFGGIPAAAPNPTKAKGVMEFLPELKDKVVNISTCPANYMWVVGTIVNYLLLGKLPELDDLNRPKPFFGELIHNNCERRGHFEAGEFVEEFGSEEEAKGYCLYKMGCKGPETHAACPVTRWNNKINWCVHAGAPCMGCAEPDFWDKFTPLYERLPGVRLPGGLGNVSADTIGAALGIVTAAGLGVHLVGQIATGRLGKGGPSEGGDK